MSDQESVARSALAEITPEKSVGALLERTDDGEGVATLIFAADLSGYPGWSWTVSVAELPGEEPTVLEAELLPGPGALLAPDWVPWAERLEEYRAAQAAAAAEAGDAEDDSGGGIGAEDLEDEDLEDDDEDDGFEEVDDEPLAVAAARVDEQDEAEPEADDDGPEPPDEA